MLRAWGASIPNTIAAVLLKIRDQTGKVPHVYFGWTEGNPLKYLATWRASSSSARATSPLSRTKFCAAPNPTPKSGRRFTSAEVRARQVHLSAIGA
jgi:hypothetical protein